MRGARLPGLYIPLVVKSAFEHPYTFADDDFVHFAERHLGEIRLIYPETSAKEAFSSLVQSWLFFGTLSEFFERSISIESFSVRNADGDRVLCTSALQDLRSGWIASLPRRGYFTASSRQLENRRCAVQLARAAWAYTRIEDLAGDDACLQKVVFSVNLLLSSLCQTVRVVLGPTTALDAILKSLAFRPAAADGRLEIDFLLWTYMVDNGWCPYRINDLMKLYTPTSMVYLASIQRKRPPTGHESCLEAGCCKAAQIDWGTFQTPHVTTGCSCAHVAVDEQEILTKIENGQIPLVSCARDTSGDFSIEITHVNMQMVFAARTSYFAISHVSLDPCPRCWLPSPSPPTPGSQGNGPCLALSRS